MRRFRWMVAVSCCLGLVTVPRLTADTGDNWATESPIGEKIAFQRDYSSFIRRDRAGIEMNLDLNNTHWKLGEEKFDGGAVGAELTIFSGINQYLDFRIAGAFWQAEDRKNMFTMGKVGVGSKIQLPTESRLLPSFVVMFNYYIPNADWHNYDVEVDNRFGFCLKAGLAYLFAEAWAVGVDLKYETFFNKTNAEIDNLTDYCSFYSAGLTFGLVYLF